MQNKSEMINRIAELAEENAELKAKIKKYAELNEIDTRDYAALHNENIKLNAIIDSYQPRLQRYKDILQEIKEIVSNIIDGYIRPYGDYEQLKKILDLITKAEEE